MESQTRYLAFLVRLPEDSSRWDFLNNIFKARCYLTTCLQSTLLSKNNTLNAWQKTYSSVHIFETIPSWQALIQHKHQEFILSKPSSPPVYGIFHLNLLLPISRYTCPSPEVVHGVHHPTPAPGYLFQIPTVPND